MGKREKILTKEIAKKESELDRYVRIDKEDLTQEIQSALGIFKSRYDKVNELSEAMIMEMAKERGMGLSINVIAVKNMVTPGRLKDWMSRGKDDVDGGKYSLYAELYLAMGIAENRMVEGCLTIIKKAAVAGDWKAAAWILERTRPAEFAETNRIAALNEEKESGSGEQFVFDVGNMAMPKPRKNLGIIDARVKEDKK